MASVGFTHAEEIRSSFTFKDFSALRAVTKKGTAIDSPVVFSLQQHDFVLRLYPLGHSTAEDGKTSIFLTRIRGPAEPILVKLDLALHPDRANVGEHFGFRDFNQIKEAGYTNFFLYSSVTPLLIKDDNLVVNMHVIARHGDYSPDTSVVVKATHSLATDLAAFLESGVCADITLQLSGCERRVHKVVLMARSPVFRQMFETDMIESRTGNVHMTDMEESVIDIFLKFLYTDSLPEDVAESETICRSLLPVACKYEIKGLMEHCTNLLSKRIKVENAADLLKIADALGATQLRDAAMKFIASSREVLIEVQDTVAFDSLDKDLMKELFAAMTGKKESKRQRDDQFEFPEGSDWQNLTAAQLRRACAERQLTTTGNKAALRSRLPS